MYIEKLLDYLASLVLWSLAALVAAFILYATKEHWESIGTGAFIFGFVLLLCWCVHRRGAVDDRKRAANRGRRIDV